MLFTENKNQSQRFKQFYVSKSAEKKKKKHLFVGILKDVAFSVWFGLLSTYRQNFRSLTANLSENSKLRIVLVLTFLAGHFTRAIFTTLCSLVCSGASPVGLVLTSIVAVMYKVAISFEG